VLLSAGICTRCSLRDSTRKGLARVSDGGLNPSLTLSQFALLAYSLHIKGSIKERGKREIEGRESSAVKGEGIIASAYTYWLIYHQSFTRRRRVEALIRFEADRSILVNTDNADKERSDFSVRNIDFQ